MVQTQTANGADKKTKERGNGPVQIAFVDAKGAESKRVHAGTSGVKVTVNGTAKVYEPSKLPATVKEALVNFAFSTRGKTQIANHGEDNGSNVHELFDEVFAELMGGKLYSKTEGGPRGKPFDAELWAEAYKNAAAYMSKRKEYTRTDKDGNKVPVKALSEKEHGDLVMWLKTADSNTRKARTDSWAKNGVFRKMFATLKASKMSIDSEPEVLDEAF